MNTFWRVSKIVPALVAVISLSAAVHEAGHALFVLLFGGKIVEFQPFAFWWIGSPHVSYQGVSDPSLRAIISSGGVMVTVLTGVLASLVLPFRKWRPENALLVALIPVSFIGQGVAFAIIPILHMMGATISDDAVSVIRYSGWHPLIISLLAFISVTIAVRIFLARTRFIDLLKELSKNVAGPGQEISQAAKIRYLAALFGVMAVILVISLTVGPSLPSKGQSAITAGGTAGLTLGTVEAKLGRGDTATLEFSYDLTCASGDFDIIVVSPDGDTVWEKTHGGKEFNLRSRRNKVEIDSSGNWLIRLVGSASGIDIKTNWEIIQ